MEYIRSFIAIELPEESKTDLKRIQSRLKYRAPQGVRWVDPNSMHLTLKFLGEVPSDKIAEVTAAIEEAVEGISTFRLEVKGLGAFPTLNRVRVVWVGMVGDIDKLARLVERIESKVSPLGFPTESRPFSPHLTLARVSDKATPADRQELGKLIENTAFESDRTIEVTSVSLMKSQLTREGAVYTRISSVQLK